MTAEDCLLTAFLAAGKTGPPLKACSGLSISVSNTGLGALGHDADVGMVIRFFIIYGMGV